MYKYLILLFVVLLFVSCDPNNPRVPSRYKEWKVFHSNVDTDDPDYPIEVLEDRYRFTYGHLGKEGRIKYVNWEWECKIKNVSNKTLEVVEAHYYLRDKYDVELAHDYIRNYDYNSSTYKEIKPKEVYTFKRKPSMQYRFMKKVNYRARAFGFKYKE